MLAVICLFLTKLVLFASAVYLDLPRPTLPAALFLWRDEALALALLGVAGAFAANRGRAVRLAVTTALHFLIIGHLLLSIVYTVWGGFFRLGLLSFLTWATLERSLGALLSSKGGIGLGLAIVGYGLLGWTRRWLPLLPPGRWALLGAVAYSVAGAAVVKNEPRNDLTRSPLVELVRSPDRRPPMWLSQAKGPIGPPPIDLDGRPHPQYQALLDRARSAPGGPLNFVVFFWESVRARNLPLYGYPRNTTPYLSSQKAHALLFSNFYAHDPRSVKSMEAFILGIYPAATWEALTWNHADVPGPDVTTRFHDAGWRVFIDYNGGAQCDHARLFLNHRTFDALWLPDESVDDRQIVPALARQLDESQEPDKPFFAFLWNVITHHPYDVPPDMPRPFGEATTHDKYDNTLFATDRLLGDLIRMLSQRRLLERTVIVVVGDHGEVFGEHRHDNFGHGQYVYEESVHVPMLLLHPSLFDGLPPDPRGFQLKDLGPSLLDLAGVDPRLGSGRSVFRDYRDERVYLSNCFTGRRLAVREGRWKLMLDLTVNRRELYDLVSDPNERIDLSTSQPALTAELAGHLDTWFAWHQTYLRDRLNHHSRTAKISEKP